MDDTLSPRKIGKYLRKLNIKDDTILLIQNHSPLADSGNMDALVRGLKTIGLRRVVVVIVEDINAIKAVSEADMNNAGWYHIKTLKGMLYKTSEEKNEQSHEVS